MNFMINVSIQQFPNHVFLLNVLMLVLTMKNDVKTNSKTKQ